MIAPSFLTPSPRKSAAAACAAWSLSPGQAASLKPRHDATLQVNDGQLWITFDGPHSGHANQSGDHFLGAGEQLRVRAGQRLVLEPLGRPGSPPVRLQWAPRAGVPAPDARQSRQGGGHGVRPIGQMDLCDAM